MDLAINEKNNNYGIEVPTMCNSKNLELSGPVGTRLVERLLALENELTQLDTENKSLRATVTRKYVHCHRLKREIKHLQAMLDSGDEPLESQSGVATTNSEPGLTTSESAPMAEQQITAFADQDAGWVTEIHGQYDETMDRVESARSNLGEFLSRPIRQSVTTWTVGQPLFIRFNPWKEFLENPFVRDKIANYELFRCKMHCKMVISGTKFHYGRALASYNPLAGFDQVTVERNFLQQDLVQASQKPHFFLNPTKNTGGELCMPFFWEKNYLSLTNADYEQMGEINVKSFGNLLHANGGNDPVTVTIYLWAEDVVLTMPTSRSNVLASQSGRKKNTKSNLGDKNKRNSITANDEYGSGIISKPAAAIAKASGALSVLPSIRPYALATEMVASRIGEVAKIFGYSRPSVVTDIQLFKPNPTGNLANSDAADAVQKLTLDSKAELTLDTRTAGLDGVDQMGILDMAQRESYLTSFTWSPDEGPDTILWNSYVTPTLFAKLNSEIHPTPMAMLSSCFEAWTGSVRFRFQIVKSDFHKGRLLVRYDPQQNSPAVEYNTNYSRVVDIAEEDDFEIVVGWAQADAWLKCGTMTGNEKFDTLRLPSDLTGEANGLLEINVLNDLVCPGPDSPISINVFVSMCEDAKFAAPSNAKLNTLHIFPPVNPVLESQSGMLDGTENPTNAMTDRPTGSNALQTIAEQGVEADHTYSVFYGDPPTTLRELMKRYTYTRSWIPGSAPEGRISIQTLFNKDAPYQSGWDPDGIDTSEVNGTTQLTVVNKDFASWWTPCFAGVRGARRKKYFFTFGGAASTPVVQRDAYRDTNNGSFSIGTYEIATTSPQQKQKWATLRIARQSGTGSATTNLGINNTIEVELPFYSPKRFLPARFIRAQQIPSNTHRVVTTTSTPSETGPNIPKLDISYQQWDAVGEDFTLMFFTGCPILYNYVVNESS